MAAMVVARPGSRASGAHHTQRCDGRASGSRAAAAHGDGRRAHAGRSEAAADASAVAGSGPTRQQGEQRGTRGKQRGKQHARQAEG
eukprot:1923836-Prymnesium_polylepis.1